jgi:MIP family channel proteins
VTLRRGRAYTAAVAEPDAAPLPERGPAAYVAEFIGTFALTFFICSAVCLFVSDRFTDFVVIGLVHAFALFFLIQTLAGVSGANLNPAITIALAATRQIKPPDAVIYVVAQLAGAVAAALLVRALFSEFDNAATQNYGAPAISDRLGGKVGLGMLAEFIGTFFLVWAVAGSAVNPRANKDWAALTIGLTLGVGALVFAPLTGAALNPARAFGPSLVADAFGGGPDFLLTYVLAPVLGGLAAAFIYVTMFIAPGKKEGGAEPVG